MVLLEACFLFPLSEWREYCVKYLPLVSDQITVANRLFPSLITLNSRGILAPSQQLSPQQAEELRQLRSDLLKAQIDKSTQRRSIKETNQDIDK